MYNGNRITLIAPMDAFTPDPPAWTETATHAHTFACPQCGAGEKEAQAVPSRWSRPIGATQSCPAVAANADDNFPFPTRCPSE